MRLRIRTNHSRIRTLLLGVAVVVGTCLVGCTDELADFTSSAKPSGGLNFKAYIEEEGTLSTRAEGLDSIYVAYEPWNQDFYIELNTTDDNGNEFVKYGLYEVPSAYEGRLEPKDVAKALNWNNLKNAHTFYSWTIPWMKTASEDTPSDNPSAEDEGTQYYSPSDESVPVYFYNSSEEHGYEQNHNNAVYEGFIGAKSEAFSYAEHGKYVELTFHHLVSKIKIASLILIQTDGSVQKNLQADMTFVGMPVQATFYPHPKDGDKSGAPKGWRPYVGEPYEASPDTGVTYYIHNRPNFQDIFYVCPEVNFSKIDYQIKINTKGYENLQTYYGTFDDVVFEREPGWGYDRGEEDENGEMTDAKILHAGEEMLLNIVLIPGKGPGLKVIIKDWSTEQPRESEYHPHQGFYSDAELQEMLELLYGFDKNTYDNPPAELELLFEMYGYTGEDGKKYFPLYENLTPRKGNSVSGIFPIPPGYIIDGMGHVVTLKTNEGSYWPNEGRSKYFNVGGLCRDIYFTDENGNNTIYIDSDGYIWVTNPETGLLEQTKNKLPAEMRPGIRGFDISCTTGSIRETEYYNDNITG